VLRVDEEQDIVLQGSSDTAVYVVLRGAFEATVTSADADERVVATMTEGSVFGELSFLDDLPRSATVRATEPSEVLRLDRGGFTELEEQQPRAASRIYRDLARVATRRLRHANERLVADSAV
jgi:CRP-like cAMP-binding protein